ncbi:MAG: zinc-ribbon domain-containing protein [Desulfobacterales bacterium]|nr:MAG: zinc-ribbon domain-containing protein [Desulfobacterales bacterium]
MIVTCEKCNTAFDLDDELIQESGSEVKCSECQNVFTVHKSTPVEGPQPSSELEEDAVEISAAEEPAEEEFDIEALGLEEELEAEAPAEIEGEAAEEETPEPVEEAPSEELDLEAISRAVEEAAEEPEAISEEAPEEEVLDFDLLEAEEPAAERPAEEAMEFEELSVDEEPGAEEPALVEEVPAVEEAPEPVREQAVVEEAEAEEEPEVEPVEEKPMPPPVAEKALPTRKRLSAPVMILLVFGLVAGGAFGAYVLLKDKVPFLQSLTGAPQTVAIDPGNLHITIIDEQITTEFVENSKAGRVFVIRGMARNDYPEARNFIRVKGILYSQDGKAVHEKLSYCGNALSDKGLQTLDKATMDSKFQNRMGDNRSNFEIPAGKTVPFMVLFSDLAPDFVEYSVQVVSSAQTK